MTFCLLTRLRRLVCVPHRTTGLALLRITLGTVVLINLLSHVKEWLFLYGPSGMVPFNMFIATMRARHTYSLFALSPAPSFVVMLIALTIVISALMVLGWCTRVISPLFAITVWSLYERNLFLLDGGDNLLYLLAFWLPFCDSGLRLSLDADEADKNIGPFRAILHNWALAGIVTQISILYITSALAKVAGHAWQNGTAIYYILRTDEFNLSPVTPYIWKYGAVVVILTYGTVAFQLSWPFLIWSRRFKLAAALGAVALHTSIAYFMGLTWFSLVMLGAEFAMFNDSEYRLYASRLSKVWKEGLRAPRPSTSEPVNA